MFSVEDRDRLRDRVLEMASSDTRVVAGAVIGSLSHDEGDRWSDLDLMFAVTDDVPVPEVLEDWSQTLVHEVEAVKLFDLSSGPITYRVFLLPGSLELDLSFAPASEFGAGGPKFRLLFGEAVEQASDPPPPADELFGYAVHHALHARVCIERGRYWQAEYWISAVRDHALHLACRARGLDGYYGRDFDELPDYVAGQLTGALVQSLDGGELCRALGRAVAALLGMSDEVPELAEMVGPQLRELVLDTATWSEDTLDVRTYVRVRWASQSPPSPGTGSHRGTASAGHRAIDRARSRAPARDRRTAARAPGDPCPARDA